MTNESFLNNVDREHARKKAVAIVDRERDLCFQKDQRGSYEANRFWLRVFWEKFNAMVMP